MHHRLPYIGIVPYDFRGPKKLGHKRTACFSRLRVPKYCHEWWTRNLAAPPTHTTAYSQTHADNIHDGLGTRPHPSSQSLAYSQSTRGAYMVGQEHAPSFVSRPKNVGCQKRLVCSKLSCPKMLGHNNGVLRVARSKDWANTSPA